MGLNGGSMATDSELGVGIGADAASGFGSDIYFITVSEYRTDRMPESLA